MLKYWIITFIGFMISGILILNHSSKAHHRYITVYYPNGPESFDTYQPIVINSGTISFTTASGIKIQSNSPFVIQGYVIEDGEN